MTVKPWNLLKKSNYNKEKDTKTSRIDICRACSSYNSSTDTCKICKCFMPMKTMLAEAECPIGRWSAEPQINKNTQHQI